MPDQSSASTEHAITQEVEAPLAELPDDPLAGVAQADFPVALRGYDRVAVDAYVKHVSQLVAELYANRTPQGAVRRALERVGEQVSEILQRAHQTAEELTVQSRAEAEERLVRAREEAADIEREARTGAEEITRDAQLRAGQLDAEVDHIWAERDRIVGDVRKLAEDLAALASTASTRFPAAAEEQAAPEPVPAVIEEAQAVDQPTVVEQPTSLTESTQVFSTPEPRVIDLLHLGRERVIGCWQVGDVLIDPGPASCMQRLLDALGEERPRALLLTHIHLDHAGVAGSLVARWPDLEVYVHERGAPHLIDPSRLLDSARRLYGKDMQRLWGDVLPVPEENIRALSGGEWVLDDLFEVAYTPGHASHHVAYLFDDGTAFAGDAAGVRITPETLTIPPTPPPDIDIEAWHTSIEYIADWHPDRLAITHFGSSTDVADQLAEVSERLDAWAALAQAEDQNTFIATITEEIEQDAGAELLATYTQAAPPEQLYAGLERYWSKREDAQTQASTHAGRSSKSRR